MANPELAYLRQLMGDTWVDTNVFGDDPQHLLGRWQKRNPNNLWVPYSEELAKTIITSKNIQLDTATLAQKLDADYRSSRFSSRIILARAAEFCALAISGRRLANHSFSWSLTRSHGGLPSTTSNPPFHPV